jgi:hypothetical protein
VPALGDAALKSLSECSFTAGKLRFFERFRGAAIGIAWLSLDDFSYKA